MVIAWWMWRLQIKATRSRFTNFARPHRFRRGAAGHLLERSNRRVKLALMMDWFRAREGRSTFGKHQGNLRAAVLNYNNRTENQSLLNQKNYKTHLFYLVRLSIQPINKAFLTFYTNGIRCTYHVLLFNVWLSAIHTIPMHSAGKSSHLIRKLLP